MKNILVVLMFVFAAVVFFPQKCRANDFDRFGFSLSFDRGFSRNADIRAALLEREIALRRFEDFRRFEVRNSSFRFRSRGFDNRFRGFSRFRSRGICR